MSRLVFKADDLRRVVAHALAAPTHSEGYGGAKGDVILVHDQGVYLMSAGQPRDLISEGGVSSYVAYAQGRSRQGRRLVGDGARDRRRRRLRPASPVGEGDP